MTLDSLMELVERRLGMFPGEHMFMAQYVSLPRALPSFDEFRGAAVADMNARFAQKQASVRVPSDPSLLSIKSWQFGFTEAGGDHEVGRAFGDGLYLRLQSWRGDYLSSEQWRAGLEAFDRPSRWVERGREAEEEGWTIEANACFAAARWLEPEGVEASIAGIVDSRSRTLPARLLKQPDTSYPREAFARRHWLAWDMKNYGRLDLPTLLRWECDRNFSIRTRIYRSLGQRPHPASIQALREGTYDPHTFARAQAARSLGWCADPGSVGRLRALAESDPDPEVRRTAAKAVQRIIGFWSYYGEWNAISQSGTRVLEVARELADKGLAAFASQIASGFGGDELYDERDVFVDELEPLGLDGDWDDERRRYPTWFKDAMAVEQRPSDSSHEEHGFMDEDSVRGFERRQLMRRLGVGAMADRRLGSGHPLPTRDDS